MCDLTNPSKIREIFDSNGIKINKKLGQNFLIDNNIIEKILKESEITSDTNLFEIGPGLGALTIPFSKIAKKTVAVELDKKLSSMLCEFLSHQENIKIINEDILNINLETLFEKEFANNEEKESKNKKFYEEIVIVANLPYYITTPIITKVLEEKIKFKHAIFMMQKEVAERLTNKDGTSSSIGLFLSYHSEIEILFDVSENCFLPKPKITSTVVRIKKIDKYKDFSEEKLMFKIIKASFLKKRKKMTNSLSCIGIEKNQILETLEAIGIRKDARPEQLNIENFMQFTLFLKNLRPNI